MHICTSRVVVDLEEEVNLSVMGHEIISSFPHPAKAVLLVAGQLVKYFLVERVANHLTILVESPRRVISLAFCLFLYWSNSDGESGRVPCVQRS